MKVKFKESDRVIVDDDIYGAEIVEILEKQGSKGNFLLWKFKITDDGPFLDVEVRGNTPAEATRKNRLTEWLAVLGLDTESLETDDDIDLDGYVGRKCRIDVQVNKEGTWSNVVGLRRAKKAESTDKPKPSTSELDKTVPPKDADEKPKPKPTKPKEDEDDWA